MKKILCAVIALALSATVLFSGCFSGGGSLEVNVNNTYESMTDEQWQEYKYILNNSTPDSGKSLQTAVNGSLLSGVSILTRFTYNDITGYVDEVFGGSRQIGKPDYHSVYCGAGVIVELDKEAGDAYIITNCHVVYSDASKETVSDDIKLYLYGQDTEGVNFNLEYSYVMHGGNKVYYREDGNEYWLLDYNITDDGAYAMKAEVVCASIAYDIALLKVSNSQVLKNSGAKAAEFVKEDDVYAGARAYAVGNPDGDGMSATVGFVTKESEEIFLNLSDNEDEDAYGSYRVIRTDAAINGGNSGGGFYNEQGKLIGIVNSKSTGDDIDNMGYALPASYVRRLWVLMKETSPSYFSKKNPYVKAAIFPAGYKVVNTVSYMNPLGVAEIAETVAVTAAGGNFKAGDVLKHITIKNGETVIEDKDITRAYHIDDTLLSARDGYTVIFTVIRNGQQTEVQYSASLARV